MKPLTLLSPSQLLSQVCKPVLLASAMVVGTIGSQAVAEGENVIRISKKAVTAPHVAIVPFENSNLLSPIIAQDLQLSGQFSLDKNLPQTAHYSQNLDLALWRSAGIPYVAVGRVKADVVEFELVDVSSAKRLLGEAITVPKGKMRDAGHLIADKIYAALTGKKSDFSGQLAFIAKTPSKKGHIFSLQIAATDGVGAQVIFQSNQPIRSPAWSPDGSRIAYVSYESGFPAIYVQNLSTGAREAVVQYAGTNGAPSFSPDGRKLLFSSSTSGDFEIYVMDLATKRIRNLTGTRGADTEPSFAADGRSFVFTSDRSGSPQIYQYSFLTGNTRRLTLSGNYNTRPSLSADGTKLSLIHNYRAAIMDMASGAISMLGGSSWDESPSFSPNGDVLVYATKAGGRDIVTMVSANGQTRMNLPSKAGDVRDPAWAPKR